MRLKAPLGMSTYLMPPTPPINPVDLWTLRCVADPLQDGSLPRICSSNDKHSELDIWDMGTLGGTRNRSGIQVTSTLLCTHGTESVVRGKTGKGVDHTLEPGACCIHTVQTSADYDSLHVGTCRSFHGPIVPEY